MSTLDRWAEIIASSLTWEQAHANLDTAVKGLPAELRGRRPDGLPYSVWELVEHIRITQHDLLEFCANENYHEPHWPADYWPKTPAPPDDSAWDASLREIRREAAALGEFTKANIATLHEQIPPPRGSGQTYLRTVLVAVDHASHHVGQIIAVRRLLGAWPP